MLCTINIVYFPTIYLGNYLFTKFNDEKLYERKEEYENSAKFQNNFFLLIIIIFLFYILFLKLLSMKYMIIFLLFFNIYFILVELITF